jgi:hypothetical protein
MIYTIVCSLIEKLNKDNDERKIFEANEKERIEKEREEEELVSFLKFLSISFEFTIFKTFQKI